MFIIGYLSRVGKKDKKIGFYWYLKLGFFVIVSFENCGF